VAREDSAGRTHFERLVFALDERLRRHYEVFEYSDHPDCLFRSQFEEASQELVLSDGTRLHPGSRLINLHLWNEHIPQMGPGGPTLGWARQVWHLIEFSLCELARYLQTKSDLDDILAIRANMTLGLAEQIPQLERISERVGFERVPAVVSFSLAAKLHRGGDNFLALLFVLARNPASARLGVLLRDRAQVLLSRKILDRRYGSHPLDRIGGYRQ
jgi:YkoP domain